MGNPGAAAVALLGVLALAGCGSTESSGAPSPSVSPTTASPSATPTVAAEPVMPQAAKAHTKAGAEAFVRYYWEVVNYAQATGDTDGLHALSSTACDGCQSGIDAITRTYEGGGQVSGGSAHLAEISISFGWVEGRTPLADVEVTVKTAPSNVAYPNSAKNRSYDGGTTVYEMSISAPTGDWQVGKLAGLST